MQRGRVMAEKESLLGLSTILISSGMVGINTQQYIGGSILLGCGLVVLFIRGHFKQNGRWIQDKKKVVE